MGEPGTVIVGAGISGLATAFCLRERRPDLPLVILESANRAGGTIHTHRQDGFQVELGANGFLDNKPSTLRLCEKLGLTNLLIPAATVARHRFLFLGDRLHRLPEGIWSFLASPLIGWKSKLAVLMEGWQPRGGTVNEESVHDFITRRTTAEVAEVLGDALVTGIHAGDAKLLSAAAAFPRLVQWEREFGSVLRGMKAAGRERTTPTQRPRTDKGRGSRLLSFAGGVGTLIEALEKSLAPQIVHNQRVMRIAREDSPDSHESPIWTVHAERGQQWRCSRVILACPAHAQADIVAELDRNLAAEMRSIAYAPAVVVGLGYRREDVPFPLDGFGFIAPQRLRRDILGVQWCSSLFPERAPPGEVLLRALAGGWHRPEIASWEDNQLVAAVRQELRIAMRIAAVPRFQYIRRWPQAIPQYHIGHLQRVSRIEELVSRRPGLFVTGNAYHGVSMNDCTEQAERIADKVAAEAASKQ